MGNRPGICGGSTAQNCVDECTRLQFELEGRSREAEDPECDPAGAVFNETLQGLAPLDQEVLRFAGMSNLAAVRWLLAMGTSPKARDRNGTTMLHAACRSGTLSIVQELVRRGIPLDSADSSGWTALHIAAVMGRREVCMLLVRARASLVVKNKRGKTPLMLCTDPGTKEVLKEVAEAPERDAASGEAAQLVAGNSRPGSLQADFGIVPHAQDDYVPACEPFFVPRVPLFHDEANRAEIIHLGMEMFNQSAGHGLAFFVASGIVHDHPTDLNAFLLRYRADPAQLGEFLGEDFSLAQTLRLASIHSVDLTGTGVVSALLKSFQHICAPPDLRKIDRITSAIAHLWWRTHDLGGEGWPGWDDGTDDYDEGLDWSLFVEDPAAMLHGDLERSGDETCGMELRRCLHSVEGLRRLMFSTVMLCWNLHASTRALPTAVSPRRLSLSGWMDMNACLEADGTNIPAHVQKGIYQRLARQRIAQLLPYHGSPPTPANQGGSASTSSSVPAGAEGPKQDNTPLVRGWASIPHGGLERQDPAMQGALAGPRHCIISETSSAAGRSALPGVAGLSHPGQPRRGEDKGEAVWLSLRFSFLLFLSSSPSDPAPYAFVRLQDAVIRDLNHINRNVILAGRPKGRTRPLGVKGGASEADLSNYSSPFGDTNTRLPLPLCFLLADGRFQPFDALWLELQFNTDEDLEMWARELSIACDWSHVTKDDPKTRLLGARSAVGGHGPPTHVPPMIPPGPGAPAGPGHTFSTGSPQGVPAGPPQGQYAPDCRKRGPALPVPSSPPPSPPVLSDDARRDFDGPPRPAG